MDVQGRPFKLVFKLEFEYEFEYWIDYTFIFRFSFDFDVSTPSLQGVPKKKIPGPPVTGTFLFNFPKKIFTRSWKTWTSVHHTGRPSRSGGRTVRVTVRTAHRWITTLPRVMLRVTTLWFYDDTEQKNHPGGGSVLYHHQAERVCDVRERLSGLIRGRRRSSDGW